MIVFTVVSKTVHKAVAGPDEVVLTTSLNGVSHELRVRVPQGLGDAYIADVGPQLAIEKAQITEAVNAPVSVVLDSRGAAFDQGGPYDFETKFQSPGEARAYLKSLGFSTATVIKPRDYIYKAGPRAGLRRVNALGEPVLLMLPEEENL